MISVLCITAAARALPPAFCDQQAPTQHAPASHQYQDLKAETEAEKKSADEKATSSVTLQWRPIAGAGRYILKISRDPDGSNLFYTVETINTVHSTPELPPGAYYYIVEGYQDERRVGQTSTTPFVVGKPLALSAKKERLPAPTIIGPKHLDLYPTHGYVRVAWQEVPGARGYRFRLWNEDKVKENQRWKRDTPPRWITEVKNPWLEVHDAPYSSYMYLESGLYRWDVAAVDKDGSYVGDTAMGFFKVSRQWFFKPNDFFIRAQYVFAPNEAYYQDSSITGEQSKFQSTSHRLDADFDWWFLRQWGVNVGGGFQSLSATSPSRQNPADTLLFIHGNVDLLFRTYLSTVPWGWWLVLSAGLGMQEFPQIDTFNAGNIHVSRPKALGAKLGFQIHKRWNNPLEMQLSLASLIHAYTLTAPTGASTTNAPLDLDLQAKLFYHWTYHFASYVGLGGETKHSQYTPQPFISQSNVIFQGINVTIGFQFNYYPPPDNSSYFPGTPGAYYPSERVRSYYKSEERIIDDHQKDSSSWPRWRPR